jgi:hypothetical protein
MVHFMEWPNAPIFARAGSISKAWGCVKEPNAGRPKNIGAKQQKGPASGPGPFGDMQLTLLPAPL